MSVTWVPMAKLALQLDGQLIPLGLLVTVPVPVPEVVTVRTAEVLALKVAVTEMAPLIVTRQLPAPVHPPPLQPENAYPDPADAVSVTTVLLAKLALQVPGQLIPLGLLVTVPDRPGVMVTWRVGLEVKVAVTELAFVIAIVQTSVPLHPSPLHPVNVDPGPGFAVSTTWALLAKDALQVEGQSIPLGLLVTVPDPATVTWRTGSDVKFAVTALAAATVNAHSKAPVHAPLQPANEKPLPAFAVSVNCVSFAKLALQVDPQEIPAGLLVTVPVPDRETVIG
jgi:phage tail protein X